MESLTWTAEGHALKISYTQEVMNEMSEAAWEGLQKVPRRGLEVGGVLYGTRSDDELRITRWRPIPCEHAKGPGFELSANDEAALKQMIEESASSSELSGLEPLGWFHSHTRDDIFLSEIDVDLYKRFFPAPWQVALVLKPHMQQPTRGGFFFREKDGSLRATSSHQEFTLSRRSRRLPVGFDPSNRQVRTPGGESLPPAGGRPPRDAEPAPVRMQPPLSAPPSPLIEERSAPKPRSRRWVTALIAVLLVVPAVIILGLPLMDDPASRGIALQVRDADGQVIVEWDQSAPAVMGAQRGSLRIIDGANDRSLTLSREELLTGNLTYARETGDVEFRLDLIGPKGDTVSEIARFLGEPPAASEAPGGAEDLQQRLELEAEADRLRMRLEEEATRNRELRDRVQALRDRLTGGATPDAAP